MGNVSPLELTCYFRESELILHEHGLETECLIKKCVTPHFEFTLQRNGEEQTPHALYFLSGLSKEHLHI